MADPFNILANSANSTTGLFKAIAANQNTAYEAKRSAMAAEANLATSLAQTIESTRMHDIQMDSMRQKMLMDSQKFAAWEADRRVQKSMEPLAMRARESQYIAQIHQNTQSYIEPYLDDLKPDIANFIFDHPELAAEAQQNYLQMTDGIAKKLMSNPSVNPEDEIVARKQQMRDWIEEKKLINKPPERRKVFGFDIPVPNKKKEYDVLRSTSIYKEFGGDAMSFAKKHNPEYKKSLDSSYEIMKLTGKIDPEVWKQLPQDMQQDFINTMKSRENAEKLQFAIQSSQRQLNDLLDTKNAGGVDVSAAVAAKQNELKGLMSAYTKELGIIAPPNPESEPVAKLVSDSDRIALDKIREKPLFERSPEEVAIDIKYDKESAKKQILTSSVPIPEKAEKRLNAIDGVYATSFVMSDFTNEDIAKLLENAEFRNAMYDVMADISTEYQGGKMQKIPDEMNPINMDIEGYISGKTMMTVSEKKEMLKRVANVTPRVLEYIANRKQ